MEPTANYIKRLTSARERLLKDKTRPAPSWVRITTITMGSKFQQEIDLPKFHANFVKLGSISVRPQGTSGPGTEWKLSDTAFYNQVSIKYRDQYSGKSIKLFPNGRIHVTGCSSLFDCKWLLGQLAPVVKMVLGLEEVPTTAEPEIWMINTNFSFNTSVNIHKLIDKLRPLKNQFRVFYEPARYSAVIIKFTPGPGMREVSSSIFKSGKTIVTGAQKLEEIAGAYEILNSIVDPSMMVKPVQTPETFGVILGWTFEEWAAHLVNQDKNLPKH